MVVSLSNRKRIKKRKTPPAKKNATTGPNKRMLAPVRQRRGRYADTTSRTNTGDGMALLNAVRSQGKLEALHDQSKKTIENLEMRLGKAEATLRHKLDGHRVERDGDIGMGTMPPTVPLHSTDNDDGASQQAPTPDVDMAGAAPMPKPNPMGAVSTPKPQKSPQRIARPKSSMEVDSVSPSDFIQKRPSTSSLVQPTSSRARVGDGQLVPSAAARAKPDRGDRDDAQGGDLFGNKKQKSVGFGTQAASAITNTNKKMRAQPGGVVDGPLALPPSSTGIEAPTQLSRKQHAVTQSQFAQITNGEDDDDI